MGPILYQILKEILVAFIVRNKKRKELKENAYGDVEDAGI